MKNHELCKAAGEIRKAFIDENIPLLRELSNRYTDKGVLKESKEFIDMSIIGYALSKMLEKPHYKDYRKWGEFKKSVMTQLAICKMHLKERSKADVGETIESMVHAIGEVDEEMKRYCTKLIDKARIKKAAQIYGKGLSLGKAAEITGADRKQLLDYVGKTLAHEFDDLKTLSIKKRVKNAREIFK